MSERPTPETDSQIKTFTSVSKLKRRFECSTGKVSAEFARRLERERDEVRERAKELAELVDASYIFVELHKPDCEYNKKWRAAWMEKAKRLIPGVDSIWY